MRSAAGLVLALVLALLATGCATRSCPHRFRAPVLGGVAAPELPGRGAHTTIQGCVRTPAGEREPAAAQDWPRPGEMVPYGVVRRGGPAPDLLAQVQAGPRLNAHLRVT
jgi:hypothetical protein